MKPKHLAYLVLGVLLAHAGAVLLFRYFITIDGPIHVLHASLVETPWATVHQANGFAYDGGPFRLGHAVLVLLLGVMSPTLAHDVFAALVSGVVVLAAVAFLRAHGTRIGVPVLWLAPLLFNTLLIMGLFHFLLGIAVSFGTVAWWSWYRTKPLLRWGGLVLGAALAWYTHRGAPLVLCIVLLPSLLLEWRDRSSPAAHRRTPFAVVGALIILVGAFQLHRVLGIMDTPVPGALPSVGPGFLLKSLFILDRAREQWSVYGIGALLLISTVACLRARWKGGRTLLWHDVLLALFVAFAVVALLSNSPHGRRLVLSDRAHWLALLALVLWVIAMADHARGGLARLVGITALCALPLNALKLVHVERSLATLEGPYRSMMEAGAALRPNSMVLTAKAGTDRLQRHMVAFVAIAHNGVLIAPDEFLLSSGPATATSAPSWLRFTTDPNWLLRHWRKGIPPEVDQVLFIGGDIARNTAKRPWPTLLEDHFRPTFANDHARIYTVVPSLPATTPP